MRLGRRSWCAGAAAASVTLAWPDGQACAQAGGAQVLVFVRHATFFSQETRRSPVIDPQIFVSDATAVEGVGPQSIEHAAGLRPARLDDPPDTVVYNAQGTKLGFALDRWFAAGGTADVVPRNGGDRITCSFQKLIAFGVYSLFKIVFSSEGATFTPLEGDAAANGFTARVDGSATVVVTALQPLQSGNAIVLIYHSDGQTHGASRGQLGVTAHHELIARLP